MTKAFNRYQSPSFFEQRAIRKKIKFTYRLTEKGVYLLPVIIEFTLWGSKYSAAGGDPDLLKELKEDKERTIKKYRQLALERIVVQ